MDSVQCFGRKKTAVAVAHCKRGRGVLKVNGTPLELLQPTILRQKVFEPMARLGTHRFKDLDVRVRVRGGGQVSQVYAIRQAIARSVVAWYGKFVDESTRRDMRDSLLRYDRNLLVTDFRRCEVKKPGGKGARSKKQKSYR